MSSACPEAKAHNLQLLTELQVGDLIQFPRGLYSHWAVYIGDGEVAHLAGENGDSTSSKTDSASIFNICGQSFNKAYVKVDFFLRVAGDSYSIRNNTNDRQYRPLPADEIVGNALLKLGEVGYNVLYQNCEHFATWCRYGHCESTQAQCVLKGLSFLSKAAAAAGLFFTLARGGRLLADQKKGDERPNKS